MTKGFETLEEYQALPDDEKIDLQAVNAVLDGLPFSQLKGILSDFAPFPKLRCDRWLKELEKALDRKIALQMTEEEIIPYMREDGVLCFCKKDLHRKEKLFMLLAHESAHFILMGDEGYHRLKRVDSAYRAHPDRECNMHSPIEECANLITLLILDRCKHCEKRKKTQKILEKCIISLEKQLTK